MSERLRCRVPVLSLAGGVVALTFVVATALALAAAFVRPVPAAAATTLTAQVGPGATITLKSGTRRVTSLKAGTYTIKVVDKATNHNFHLTGQGVNRRTSVGYKGTQTWKVTLRKGTYRYVCDPHAHSMTGSFKVSAAG